MDKLSRIVPGMHNHSRDGSKKISRPVPALRTDVIEAAAAADTLTKPRSPSSPSAMNTIGTISCSRYYLAPVEAASDGANSSITPNRKTPSDPARLKSMFDDPPPQSATQAATLEAEGFRDSGNFSAVVRTSSGVNQQSVTDSPRVHTDSDKMHFSASAELKARQNIKSKFSVAASNSEVLRRALEANENGEKILECFAVCGLNQWDGELKSCAPKLLYSIRKKAFKDDEKLPMFCFSSGVVPTTKIVTSAGGGVRNPIYDAVRKIRLPNEILYTADNAFVFTLTSEKFEILYCVCIIQPTILECAALISTRSESEKIVLNVPEPHVSQRAFCVVSKFPYFSLMWQLLRSLIGNEHDYVLHRYMPNSSPADLGAYADRANSLHKIITGLIQISPPVPGGVAKFSSRAFSSPITLAIPSDLANGANTMVARSCIRALMRALSAKTIVRLLCAFFIEAKIFLYSATPGRVSACGFAMLSLLKPFDWCHSAVPICPYEMHEFVDAPTPIFIGFVIPADATVSNSHVLRKIHSLLSDKTDLIVVVDLDRDTVRESERFKTVQLPAHVQVAQIFERRMQIFRANSPQMARLCDDNDPWEPVGFDNEGFLQIVVSILEEFAQYKVWLINMVRRKLPLGIYPSQQAKSDPKLANSIANLMPSHTRSFFLFLFSTSSYSEVCDKFSTMPNCETDTTGEGIFELD